MLALGYDRLAVAPVAPSPFPHILLENFVSAADLAAITPDLPAFTKGGSFPVGSLSLGEAARELMTELEGRQFRALVANRLDLDLDAAPTMITLRGQSREKDGRIHCDSASKRVTMLLYLNQRLDQWTRQEGCLRLLRRPDDLEDYAVEVPPVDGTLLVFANGPTTWHGHKQFVGQRYVVQLNYMTNDAAARGELRRHRLSALMKRLAA